MNAVPHPLAVVYAQFLNHLRGCDHRGVKRVGGKGRCCRPFADDEPTEADEADDVSWEGDGQ